MEFTPLPAGFNRDGLVRHMGGGVGERGRWVTPPRPATECSDQRAKLAVSYQSRA